MYINQIQKEGGKDDFQFFNTSLLAMIIPSVRAFGSFWKARGVLGKAKDSKFCRQKKRPIGIRVPIKYACPKSWPVKGKKAWSVVSVTLHVSHNGETEETIPWSMILV